VFPLRTLGDFENAWLNSAEYQQLQSDIAAYEEQYPIGEDQAAAIEFQEKKRGKQANHTRPRYS
jgi:hypothetical protein